MVSCGSVARLHDDIGLRVDRIAQRQQVLGFFPPAGGRCAAWCACISTSNSAFSQTEMPVRGCSARVFGSMNAPPPVASTCGPLSSSARDHARFAGAKIGLAVTGEDFRDRHAGGDFDLGVGVDEAQAEPRGEPAADRRLAGAHHADQHDRTAAERAHDRRLRPVFRCLLNGIVSHARVPTRRHGSIYQQLRQPRGRVIPLVKESGRT